ncbi:RNA-directed RNA polymerase [ssRNA phage SRR7976323_1]|uniref:RNA-directed RNA polymerase n=1 Tax=ssRNA phage SRR7976323_1 TaxID=2786688 RepID=A0A8S5L221_9VIRU|nr:RNA-directed RNA polymerase [ssRNA phage SRR7976323_1]DAD51162.1 TPA_asm: RNA-directed RNA polymerase [ssRNA phage SRR7976323_1]
MKARNSDSNKFDVPRSLFQAFVETFSAILEQDTSFKAEYLAREWKSKLLDPEYSDSPEVRRTRAIEKWLACEQVNRVTNMRIMHMSDEDVLFTKNGVEVHAEMIARTASRFISRCVGNSPSDLSGSFSGGASTSVKRGYGTIARKYLEGKDITEGAIQHFLPASYSTAWAPRDFDCVRGNVMFTVPKSTLIDRVACKEPEYNMYIQKALGDQIRRKLLRVGINLNDQSINQGLAKEGARDNNLATIDLSSASDSVTTMLVRRLLPEEWYNTLDDCRSLETDIDGSWHLNEMFSSMGNGFTFELESLLFWGIVRAVAFHSNVSGRISVYGDDIICPTDIFEEVVATLSFFGFKVNLKKTFGDGPFRESCGSHYHGNIDVSPFYVKEVPTTVVDWIHILNSLRKWASLDHKTGVCDPTYYELWNVVAGLVVPQPLWGGDDYSRTDILVAPGRLPIARLILKQRVNASEQSRLQYGCYLHWLDTTSNREQVTEAIETSNLKEDSGRLILRRAKLLSRNQISVFPQELGII